jgi:TatA/E family protein of Tat protein translocase
MPFNLGAPELILILVIALIVFGPGKLPEIGGALGKGIREFRRASSELTDELAREAKSLKQSASLDLTCPSCGARSDRGARFCGACGAELAAKSAGSAADGPRG